MTTTTVGEVSSSAFTTSDQRIFKNRPCDACRKRKSRCVLKDGSTRCVLCDFRNQECTFLEDIPPRKRKSVHQEDIAERVPVESVRRKLSESFEKPRAPKQAVQDYADLKGPTLLKRTLGLQRRHHGLYVGHTGRIEHTLGDKNRGFGLNIAGQGNGSYRDASTKDLFILFPDEGTHLYEEEIDDLDAIENLVAPHGKALIDLYFRIVHPSFPILHKNVFLEKYARTHREFSPVLLAAVYILATDYWHYSPELSSSSKPDVSALQSLAVKSLNYAIHRPKLSTVEAGLLLLQRPSQILWPLTAQMVATGQDLGLHRNCSDWDIPQWERGLRKRLAWALFMQDKWASLVQGRPSHIFFSDWAVQPLGAEDFPENFTDENDEEGSTEVEKGRSIFTHMVTLTQILSDILGSLCSGTAQDEIHQIQSSATRHILTKAKSLQIRLKEWYTELPESLGIEHTQLRKLSSTGYLHLAYWATEITLHRCIVRTLSTCPDSELMRICQQAALARSKSAIALVRNLKPEHWQSFWYFASEFNFGLIGIFESLLSTTFDSEDDTKASVSRLREYQWTLRMAQKTTGFLDNSIAMIETAVKNSESLRTTKSMIPSNSDYQDHERHHRSTVETREQYSELEDYNFEDEYAVDMLSSPYDLMLGAGPGDSFQFFNQNLPP